MGDVGRTFCITCAVVCLCGVTRPACDRVVMAETPAHHAPGGRFRNPWPSFTDLMVQSRSVLKMIIESAKRELRRPRRHVALPRVRNPRVDLIAALCGGAAVGSRVAAWEPSRPRLAGARDSPVHTPTSPSCDGGFSGIQATWIGHATWLVQMNGLTIVTDPVWSERASAVQFAGPARAQPPGVALADIPKVDVVVVSHDHYDHLDYGSVQQLLERHADAQWFVPLGVRQWMLDAGAPPQHVHEMDWWDAATLRTTDKGEPRVELKQAYGRNREENEAIGSDEVSGPRELQLVCTPCQHNSGRYAQTTRNTLWASFCLIGGVEDLKFFFSGDTAYRGQPLDFVDTVEARDELPSCPAFKQIGERVGPFDLAALPVGAYEPRWFMSHIHTDPDDAVCIHRDVKSHHSVGMHWGTFKLTTEALDEPPARLRQALDDRNVPQEDFVCVEHGETIRVGKGGARVDLPAAAP